MLMQTLSCGIVGLPNVGKSTTFNALLKKISAQASNYPFCTIDPNVGVVDLPDERLAKLSEISKSEKIIPATVTFVDIAGIVKGASKGEGLGNKFLSNIRESDVLIHVVRCFDDDEVIHVDGKVDPISDIEVIELELILADLQMVENAMAKLEKQAKGKKEEPVALTLLKRIAAHLNQNLPVRTIDFHSEEMRVLSAYRFLTAKKMIYVANVSEDSVPEMDNSYVQVVKKHAEAQGSLVVPICARLEEELASLDDDERAEYLKELGLKEPCLNELIRTSFETLGLITFLTTGEKETRAWTVTKGATAVEAAGKIHTDIAKGLVRAETITFEDFTNEGGRARAKEAGKARMEGRDYIVRDGDVILFHHN